MIRAATYARVSTQGQADKGFSLPEQRESLAAYCERNGIPVAEHIEDAGISGTDTERPGILRLLELAQTQAINLVVCAKLDRLSRRAWHVEAFMERLQGHGVAVVFTDQAFEDTPAGALLRGIVAHVAQFELSQTAQRTSTGKRQKARDRGVMPSGRPPYGYKLVTVAEATVLPEFAGRDGELLVDEVEAGYVREVFARFLRGESLRGIARYLNEDPGYCGHNAARITGVGVTRMLRQEAYRGRRHFNAETWAVRASTGKRTRRAQKPTAEWIWMECPALVTAEQWAAAQERLAANQPPGRPSPDYLLRGAVYCGTCRRVDGRPFRCCGQRAGHNKRRPGYSLRSYSCQANHRVDLERCGVRFHAEKLEARAWTFLKRMLAPGKLGKIARDAAHAEIRQHGDPQTRLVRITKDLRTVDTEEGALLAWARKGFSERAIAAQLEPLQARRAALERELAEVSARLQQASTPEAAQERAEAIASYWRERIPEGEANPQVRRQMMTLLLRVTLHLAPAPPAFEVVLDAAAAAEMGVARGDL